MFDVSLCTQKINNEYVFFATQIRGNVSKIFFIVDSEYFNQIIASSLNMYFKKLQS